MWYMEKMLPQYYAAFDGLHSFVHLRAPRGSWQMTLFGPFILRFWARRHLQWRSCKWASGSSIDTPGSSNNVVQHRVRVLWAVVYPAQRDYRDIPIYIWQYFDAAKVSVPVCFIDLNIYWNWRLLMHRRFDFQCGLWPIIQIFVPGRSYIIEYTGTVKEI